MEGDNLATQSKPLLSTMEWGGIILFALFVVAAALAYLAHSATLLEWLKYGLYAFAAWALLWLIPQWRRKFDEGRQHGGPAEGFRRVLGPGPSIHVRLAMLAFALLGVFGVPYLHGAPREVFSNLFIIGCLGVMAWYFFATPWVPREGRASGVYLIVVFLLLVTTLGFLLYVARLQR